MIVAENEIKAQKVRLCTHKYTLEGNEVREDPGVFFFPSKNIYFNENISKHGAACHQDMDVDVDMERTKKA